MSRRTLLLIALAVSIAALRGYQLTVASHLVPQWELGFVEDIHNGHLAVKKVVQKRFSQRDTAGYLAGLKSGDEILRITNSQKQTKEIRSYFDLGEIWKTIRYDEPWSIDILREGKEFTLQMPPISKQDHDFGYRFINMMLTFKMPLLVLLIAFFLGFSKPDDDNAFLASLFFISFSFVFGLPLQYYPPGLREFGTLLSSVCLCFTPYLFAHFFLQFPARSVLDRKFPWLNKLLLIATLVLLPITTTITLGYYTTFKQCERLNNLLKPIEVPLIWTPAVIMGIGLLSLLLHFIKAETKDERRKTGILLFGAVLGLIPLAIFLTVYATGGDHGLPPFWAIAGVIISIGIFPLSFLYVVLRHRVLGIRLILRRGLQYMLVSRGFFFIEGLVIFAVIYVTLGTLRVLNFNRLGVSTFTTAGAAFGVAFALRQFNVKAMAAIDRRFFRQAYNTQQVLTDLARGVRRLAAHPDQLFDLITNEVSDALLTDRVSVFLNSENSSYRCRGLRVRSGYDDEVWCGPESYEAFSFSKESFIAKHLERFKSQEPECLEVYLHDPKSWANSLMKSDPGGKLYQEKEQLEKLNTKLIVPLVAENEILGFLSLGEKLSEEAYSKEDKQLLLSVGEQTAVALEYSRLISQVAEQEKLNRELQIATEVQAQLFPQTFPAMKTMEYTGYCRAARHVGGDYYDFLQLDTDCLGVALADVSGKGISSALLMANIQALLRSGANLRGHEIDLLFNDINRLLCASTSTHKYATFFYGVYDDQMKKLTYVNAGHCPPMVFREGNGNVERLTVGGLVVGMLPDVQYQKEQVILQSGDLLLVYSDGVSEAMNLQDEEFGEERIRNVIDKNRKLSVSDLRDAILKEIAEFVGEAPQNDDLTMVIARIL